MPIGMGQKNTTPPNTDAVQEVIVSTNSVDAESGHSAGGIDHDDHQVRHQRISWHRLSTWAAIRGSARKPTAPRFSQNSQRQNMFGGTLGNPIKKNKLFNFFSIEDWQVGYPNSYQRTVPTALEAQGDFSQSLQHRRRRLRTIFDPWTSVLKPGRIGERDALPGQHRSRRTASIRWRPT